MQAYDISKNFTTISPDNVEVTNDGQTNDEQTYVGQTDVGQTKWRT